MQMSRILPHISARVPEAKLTPSKKEKEEGIFENLSESMNGAVLGLVREQVHAGG